MVKSPEAQLEAKKSFIDSRWNPDTLQFDFTTKGKPTPMDWNYYLASFKNLPVNKLVIEYIINLAKKAGANVDAYRK